VELFCLLQGLETVEMCHVNRAAEDYLQKNNSSSYEELLNFVTGQRSSIEAYLSAADTLYVSLLLQQFVWSLYCCRMFK